MPTETKAVGKDDQGVSRLRAAFAHTFALNLIGLRGAGTTSILERTLQQLPRHTRAAVLSADVRTDTDAIRLERYGYPVRWIIGDKNRRLNAAMVEEQVRDWLDQGLELLLIENAGNPVRPECDLGEDARVIVVSVTQAEAAIHRYPQAFRVADVILLNKCDLLVNTLGLDAAIADARRIHPTVEIMQTSCLTGSGLESWLNWVVTHVERKTGRPT